jgi:hypothetical protein
MVTAQQDTFAVSLGQKPIGIEADGLGNVFVLMDDGEIRKYNEKGTLTANFRDRYLGKPTSFHVENPLRPTAVFAGKAMLIEFDNNLFEIQRWDLPTAYTSATLISRSFDGNFWWYQESERKLVKMDYKGNILIEGASMDNISSESSILPNSMIEIPVKKNEFQVAISVPKQGIYLLGLNGRFLLKINQPTVTQLKVCSEDWGWWEQGTWVSGKLNLKTMVGKNWIDATGCGTEGWYIEGNYLKKY